MSAPDRASGPAFAIENIGWIDFEARSDTDIKAGTYRYATEAEAIICSYAIGDGPVRAFTVAEFDGPLNWLMMPEDAQEFHYRVVKGTAVWAAWNAGFDKAVWNFSTYGFPSMEPHHIIDVMAQAVASGLPPDLAMASATVGKAVKIGEGKDLIKLFCTPGGLKGVRGTPRSHPDAWRAFLGYAMGDIEAMRSVFKATRQLSMAEWNEYWAMEAINERGIGIDEAFATRAAKLAEEDKTRSAAELWSITDGDVTTVDQVAKMVAWLLPRLPEEGQAILTKREEEVDDDGIVTKPAKFQLTRKRIERLLAYLDNLETHEYEQFEIEQDTRFSLGDIVRLLQIRQYGGSKTPAKFAKMLQQQVDGVLYGQYVFNGAAQTGRASSKGVQIHNLARDTIKFEADTIETITAGCTYDHLVAMNPAAPVARQLSLLIRPTFIAGPGNVFVWSDWSQIEARVLPWLCDHMPGAAARVRLFKEVDDDPSQPDLYTLTAAVLSHVSPAEVTKPMRQRGKVAELALGFCGGVGALQAMAAGYGLHFSDSEAKAIVDRWREANPWAQDYSRQIWDGMRWAMNNGEQPIRVGRVWLRYEPRYFGGSLLVRLPSGRILTYRSMRWEDVPVLDADDKPTGVKKLEMTFARGYGRVKLWPGVFVENFTQATAADFLRGTLVRLERDEQNVRLHTHDEVLLECAVHDAEDTAADLRSIMQHGFDWSDGLPINSEQTIAYSYTKSEEGHGL